MFDESEIMEILNCMSNSIAEYGGNEKRKSILAKIIKQFPNNEEVQEQATSLLRWIGDDNND